MGVMMNVNWRYWNPTLASDVVGWRNPTVHPGTTLWPYQAIAGAAEEFHAAGFTAVVLPPSCNGGAGVFSGGYDKFDDYGIDGTAFGNGEMLRQCVAEIHANGMFVYSDLVLHQYGGGKAGVYPTKRFPKTADCFAGGAIPIDPVPDSGGNFPFGDMAAYVHSLPPGYMHDGAIAATTWLYTTAGFDGFRVDEAKGTNAAVIYDVLHAGVLNGAYAFFEYFDGSPDPVSNYVNGYMKRRGPVLDFAFKFNVGDICNNAGREWMGRLAHIGYCAQDAAMAVTFVESADTDTSIGQQTIWNKMLGYAIMLTFPGYPSVYYRDWSDDPGCYGLKHDINNLVWIHENLAGGDFVVRLDSDQQVFVHERTGWGKQAGCLCGFNNDPYHQRTVRVQTNWPPNTRLHEFTGKYDRDIWTDRDGHATFTLPKNNNGMSYLVWGIWVPGSPTGRRPIATTQVFYGAADLHNPPLKAGLNTIGRIYVEADSTLHTRLEPKLDAGVSFLQPDGTPLLLLGDLKQTGFYTIQITMAATAAPTPYALTVTYQAAQR